MAKESEACPDHPEEITPQESLRCSLHPAATGHPRIRATIHAMKIIMIATDSPPECCHHSRGSICLPDQATADNLAALHATSPEDMRGTGQGRIIDTVAVQARDVMMREVLGQGKLSFSVLTDKLLMMGNIMKISEDQGRSQEVHQIARSRIG